MSSYVCRRLESSSPRRRRAGAIAVRGLHFAIVDEADSVLIDEARTPLILSANVDAEGGATRFRRALDVVGGLLAGRDYRVSETEHRIEMTTAGRQRATSLIAAMWAMRRPWRVFTRMFVAHGRQRCLNSKCPPTPRRDVFGRVDKSLRV